MRDIDYGTVRIKLNELIEQRCNVHSLISIVMEKLLDLISQFWHVCVVH